MAALLGIVAGLSIGTVGVGGVILVPVLVFLLGHDLQTAIATSSFSFLFVGLSGTAAYARRGTIPWRLVGWMGLGIVPGAFLGARAIAVAPTLLLTLGISGILILSGIIAIRRRETAAVRERRQPSARLAAIGAAVGTGSSLTGTGGPVILVPTLLSLNVRTIHAIGASQAAQIPIALAATVGNVMFGSIDYRLGLTLGLSQAVGAVVGASLAHQATPHRLRLLVAVSLIAVGILIAIRAVT